MSSLPRIAETSGLRRRQWLPAARGRRAGGRCGDSRDQPGTVAGTPARPELLNPAER